MKNVIERIKREARILSRAEGTPHRAALDRVAAAAGHSHWGSYRRALMADPHVPPPGLHRIDPPVLVGALIGRPDVTAVAYNEDGSVWARSETGWARVPEGLVESHAQMRAFAFGLPHPGPTTRFAVVGTDVRIAASIDGDRDRLAAVLSARKRAGSSVEFRLLDFATERWWLDVSDGIDRRGAARALAHVVEGRDPAAMRIIAIGCPELQGAAPNMWTPDPHTEGHVAVRDLATRFEADAVVVRIDGPQGAALAKDLAIFHNGTIPVVAVVDSSHGMEIVTGLIPSRRRPGAPASRIRAMGSA